MLYIPYLILAGLLLVSLYTDLKYTSIPNKICLGGVAAGIVYQSYTNAFQGFILAIIGAAVGFGFMFILYLLGALGAGDVKLFAAIGAIMGIEFTLYTMMYSIVFAGCIGVIVLVCRKDGFDRIKNVLFTLVQFLCFKRFRFKDSVQHAQLTFPFMIAVVPGALTALYYFEAFSWIGG